MSNRTNLRRIKVNFYAGANEAGKYLANRLRATLNLKYPTLSTPSLNTKLPTLKIQQTNMSITMENYTASIRMLTPLNHPPLTYKIFWPHSTYPLSWRSNSVTSMSHSLTLKLLKRFLLYLMGNPQNLTISPILTSHSTTVFTTASQ